MLHKLRAPIFVQILLATLLPLILIFSLVLAIIAGNVFRSSAGRAQEKTLFFAQEAAEQVRDNFAHITDLAKLVAQSLSYITCESDEAPEMVRRIARHTLENASGAYRIRIYFRPNEAVFGTKDPFAYIYYNDEGIVTGHPIALHEEPYSEFAAPWYDVPLKKGEPYYNSVSHGGPEPEDARLYVASTSYPIWRDGQAIGSVGMGMLYRESVLFLNKWGNGGSYRLLIISEHGTILYASNQEAIGKKIDMFGFDGQVLTSMEKAMQDNKPFMEEGHSPVFGQNSLICLYPIDLPIAATRVFVYLDTPTALVYSAAHASVRTVFLTFLGGLLLFAGSLFAVTRNITNPIKKLIATADRIAHGQLDAARYDFSGNHEIRHEVDSLENSLNVMFMEIEESHNLKIAAMKTEYEKKKLEESSAAKDRFFANMSHEIRTPMNVILGMSEMMLMEDRVHEQKKYAHHIKVSAEALLSIINDILDLSRLESGKLPLLPVHYNFTALMENVCSLSRYLAAKKGLEFSYEAAGSVPEVLYGDDGRLRQVLLNVVGNAIKFTEKGSVVLRVKDSGETVHFEVEDTGIGIKQEDMLYLFEPFKQLDQKTNRSIEGTGLGLSICKNLLELMGGTISVQSEYGKGAAFRVTIPKVPGDASKIDQPSDTLPTSFDPKARVLVVDDSESNLKVAGEFLRRFGITVDTAVSGAECLTMVTATDYNLIFMDHMMPEMNGIETTERIRALGGRFAKVPIVALTANAVIGSRELFLASGMNDFLAKPIERVKLQAILAKWMPEELILREYSFASGPRQPVNSGQTPGKGSGLVGMMEKAMELPDLDIRLGLSRVADNRELYEEMLGMIAEAIPAAFEKMDIAIRAEDTAALTNEAHRLKGELANVGASNLSGKMRELELAGGNMPEFTRKFALHRPDLEEFARALRNILPEKNVAKSQSEPGGWISFEDGLRELREALMGFNYAKSQEVIVNLVRFDWGESRNRNLEMIRAHIKFFDYEAALADLTRLFPKLR